MVIRIGTWANQTKINSSNLFSFDVFLMVIFVILQFLDYNCLSLMQTFKNLKLAKVLQDDEEKQTQTQIIYFELVIYFYSCNIKTYVRNTLFAKTIAWH